MPLAERNLAASLLGKIACSDSSTVELDLMLYGTSKGMKQKSSMNRHGELLA